MVMFIHGGGWIAGNSQALVPFADFPSVLASIAAHGYVVASVNYRLSGEARWPAQAQDIKAAIRFLRINAARYRIDPDRFITWGVSAGGHLSAIADLTCGVAALEPPVQRPLNIPDSKASTTPEANVRDCVQGAVSWYGVYDMSTIAEQAARAGAMSRDAADAFEWLLLGCYKDRCSSEQLKSPSPVAYVNQNAPPMLLIVGDKDKLVPYYQTLEMDSVLNSADVKHELIVMPGMNHSLIGATYDATRDANLNALQKTLQFIDQTIGTPSRR